MEIWHFCLFYVLIWGRLLSPHWPRTSDIFICCYFPVSSVEVQVKCFMHNKIYSPSIYPSHFVTFELYWLNTFSPPAKWGKKINRLKYPFAHKQAHYGNLHADTNWKYEAQKRILTFTNTHTHTQPGWTLPHYTNDHARFLLFITRRVVSMETNQSPHPSKPAKLSGNVCVCVCLCN